MHSLDNTNYTNKGENTISSNICPKIPTFLISRKKPRYTIQTQVFKKYQLMLFNLYWKENWMQHYIIFQRRSENHKKNGIFSHIFQRWICTNGCCQQRNYDISYNITQESYDVNFVVGNACKHHHFIKKLLNWCFLLILMKNMVKYTFLWRHNNPKSQIRLLY